MGVRKAKFRLAKWKVKYEAKGKRNIVGTPTILLRIKIMAVRFR
jgi:hypothetical protein